MRAPAIHGVARPLRNVFFGALHFLPLNATCNSLADFYPGMAETLAPADEAYPRFRSFCLEYSEEIRTLLYTRRVQTNAVGRCTRVLSAFGLVDEPLSLIEIWASAGLNLLCDDYGQSEFQSNSLSGAHMQI